MQIISFTVLLIICWASEKPNNFSSIAQPRSGRGRTQKPGQNLEMVFYPLCQHLPIPAPMMSHRVWSPVLSKHDVSLPHTLTCVFISNLALWPRPVPSGMLGLCYQDLLAQPPDSNWVSIPTVCLCLCVYAHKGNNFYIFLSFSAYVDHTCALKGEGVNGLSQAMS